MESNQESEELGSSKMNLNTDDAEEPGTHEQILRSVIIYGFGFFSCLSAMIIINGYRKRGERRTVEEPVDQEFMRWVDDIEQQNKNKW